MFGVNASGSGSGRIFINALPHNLVECNNVADRFNESLKQANCAGKPFQTCPGVVDGLGNHIGVSRLESAEIEASEFRDFPFF